MKNIYILNERKLLLERLSLPYYNADLISAEKKIRLIENIQKSEFKMKDFAEMIIAFDFISANPDFHQEIDGIWKKSEVKFNKINGESPEEFLGISSVRAGEKMIKLLL